MRRKGKGKERNRKRRGSEGMGKPLVYINTNIHSEIEREKFQT